VIQNEIQYHLDSVIMCNLYEASKALVVPKLWVDLVVTGRIIPLIPARRQEERGKPYCINPKKLEIGNFAHNSIKITIAVAIPVDKASRVDFINDRGSPPLVPSALEKRRSIP
jgi:hypothetical protein